MPDQDASTYLSALGRVSKSCCVDGAWEQLGGSSWVVSSGGTLAAG